MSEKICSHCGATILVGLQYCPSCLRSVRTQGKGGQRAAAISTDETRLERFQAKWENLVSWFSPSATQIPLGKDDPAFAYRKPSGTASMSDAYTRIVCPKCQRPHRAPLNQAPTGRVMCHACFHQFPASMATEFRRGADLNCLHCGVTTFCVNGLKVNQCPNCKVDVTRPFDPERTKLIALAGTIGFLIFAGFCHSVATQTTPQFLGWLCVGTVFTFFGFIALVALGY